MNRRTFLTTASAAALTTALPSAVNASGGNAPQQAQGSSPWCLFAVNAYLCDRDMWRLAAAYFRRNLPTFPDTIIPYNENILTLCGELYGTAFTVADRYDWAAARDALDRGSCVAATGSGHGIVLISWSQRGIIRYMDSLAVGVQSMAVRDFWQWADGWLWWRQ